MLSSHALGGSREVCAERLLCPMLLLLTGLSLPHALKLLYADFTT